MRHFHGLLGQGFIVIFARRVGVEREVELVFPAKLKSCLGQRIVADLRAWMPFGKVGGTTSGDLNESSLDNLSEEQRIQLKRLKDEIDGLSK